MYIIHLECPPSDIKVQLPDRIFYYIRRSFFYSHHSYKHFGIPRLTRGFLNTIKLMHQNTKALVSERNGSFYDYDAMALLNRINIYRL